MSGFFFESKNFGRLVTGFFLLLILTFSGVLLNYHAKNIALAKEQFIDTILLDRQNRIKIIDNSMEYMYGALKTIARLPGVRKLSFSNRKLSDEARLTIQEIYNNLSDKVQVSEYYILLYPFDPDLAGDNNTVLNHPLLTFDQVIVGKQAAEMKEYAEKDSEEKIPEEEIYEYRQMKLHMDQYKAKFSNLESFEKNRAPILASDEVITCDNSKMTYSDFLRGNDAARKGVVLTTPFYDKKGKFVGAIAAVFRSQILDELLGPNYFKFFIGSVSMDFGRANSPPSSELIYSEVDKIGGTMNLGFSVETKIYEDEFLQSPQIRNVESANRIATLGLFAMSVLLGFIYYMLMSSASRSRQLAEKIVTTIDNQRKTMVESAKLSSLGFMAGGIAHEINNPVAIIKTHASRLKRKIEGDLFDKDQFVNSLKSIEETAMRISKIVKGLRTISRDGNEDPFQATDMDGLVNETVELCRTKLLHHSIELRYQSPMTKIECQCRATQIGQILINLINNSYDALCELNEREKWIAIELDADEKFFRLRVTDSGFGIPESVRQKLMTPFFTTKEVGRGTGLGLSISRTIAEEHGGELLLDSSHANTSFVLKLPLKHEEQGLHDSAA